VTASVDGTARLWDTTGKAIGEMLHNNIVNFAQFSSDGRLVVTASDHTAQLWEATSGEPIGEPLNHEKTVYSAEFSPDGRRVVTASIDAVRLWDVGTCKAIGEPLKHRGPVTYAQFSPNGQRILTVSDDSTATIWDVPVRGPEDTSDDVKLLADLAEAIGGVAFVQTSQDFGKLNVLTQEEVQTRRKRITDRFRAPNRDLTPLQQFLIWRVSEQGSRTITPFSGMTLSEWVDERIGEGRIDYLREAMHVDPLDARLTAQFGLQLAELTRDTKTPPSEARRAREEADFQTRRALKLAPESQEIKTLRLKVMQSLGLTADHSEGG
jgi:hypothetical protein